MKTKTKVIVGLISALVIFCFLLFFMIATVPEEAAVPTETAAPPSLKPDSASPPSEDPFDAVDQLLKQLELGSIAFNAPGNMNFRDTALIELVLGLETPIEELKKRIEAAGEKESGRIRVSDRMEARLSGPNFAITAITPEIQAVSRSEVTEWKWEVKPGSRGSCYLHLTLSALLRVDGESALRTIRTFDKRIEVEVSWHQRIRFFLTKNWQWMWAAVLVPIAGWLWKRRKGARPAGRP